MKDEKPIAFGLEGRDDSFILPPSSFILHFVSL